MPSSAPAASAAPSAAPMWPGLALAAAGAVAFSGKAIIAKLIYRHDVDAITVVMLRMLLALPLFLLLAWWSGRGRPALSRRDLRDVAVLGFLGYYLASTLDFLGLQYVTAGFERLVLYLNPTLVLLIGVLFLKRPVGARQWAAMGVSYAGVLLVFGHEASLAGAHVALGAALVFGSALAYAIYLIASGEVVRRIGSARLTGWATSVACVLCLLQFAALRPLDVALQVPAAAWWLSLVNAVVCTFAPVLMVMMAVERIGAAAAAQTGMIGPMSTLLMGVAILGEPFTPWIAAGTGLVLAGVWLLTKWR